MQAYSVPDRFTPCKSNSWPEPLRRRLPETWSPAAGLAEAACTSPSKINKQAAAHAPRPQRRMRRRRGGTCAAPDTLNGRNFLFLGDAEGRAAAAGGDHVGVINLEAGALEAVDEVDRGAVNVGQALAVDQEPDSLVLEHAVALPLLVEGKGILKAGAASAAHADAQPSRLRHGGLGGQELPDLFSPLLGQRNHCFTEYSDALVGRRAPQSNAPRSLR